VNKMRPIPDMITGLRTLAMHYHRNQSPYHMRLYNADMELPRAIKSMLRWWEPGTAEPASISHWGIVE